MHERCVCMPGKPLKALSNADFPIKALVLLRNNRYKSRCPGSPGDRLRQCCLSQAPDGICDPTATTAGSPGVTCYCLISLSSGIVFNFLHPTVNANVSASGEIVSCGSYPVFLPLNEVPNETLPACFLLKLQPAVPALMSFVNKLSQITGEVIVHGKYCIKCRPHFLFLLFTRVKS